MAYFIMPQLTGILAQSGQTLPLLTRILIGTSNFIREHLLLVLIGIVFIVVGLIYYARSSAGRSFFNRYMLKVPILGSFLRKTYLARMALNLSTLIAGGLPIVKAIEITADVVGNEVYKDMIFDVAEGVKRGEMISNLLSQHPQDITPLFIQMVVVGEKTGRLDSSLLNVVDFYQKEVDRGLENFMRLLEPILIIIFGVIIALLMIAVITPLYQAISSY
jgi:type IV pilus assembly protein PilC